MRSLVFLLTLTCLQSNAQTYAIKDIKSFGAKGDGRTNDHDAFERAAAFFNQRGGYGRLVISKGTYIVGKQSFTRGKNNKPAYDGEDVLHFTNVRNLTVQGTKDARLKYQPGLRFGAFNPETGQPHLHGDNYFVNWQWAATLGHCIFLDNCRNISVKNIEMDGSNNEFQFGGVYGDVGIQLPHYGIFIQNSRSITIEGVNLHHFALDGISISNAASKLPDSIELKNSRFEYNSRQGLSWIGGNDLKATNCKFNHTGQATIHSAPGQAWILRQNQDPYETEVLKTVNLPTIRAVLW